MLRKILVILFAVSFAQIAYSATEAELRAELQSVLQRIEALKQILASQGDTTVVSPSSAPYSCVSLQADLQFGMRDLGNGGDIAILQKFLSKSGHYKGPISGYFGALTRASVGRWQIDNHVLSGSYVPGFGRVGPFTRKAIYNETCGGVSRPIVTPQRPVYPYGSIRDCIIGNSTIRDGTSITMYRTSNAPSGQSCTQYAQTRQCVNGVLSGDTFANFMSCSEAKSSCSAVGASINDGESRDFYSVSSVSYGLSCDSYRLRRTCSNGSLSGSSSYVYTNCSASVATNCPLDGTTVLHGSSQTFYSASLVANGSSCASVAQTRSCVNGVLSGSSTFSKSSCSVATSTSCVLDGSTTVDTGTKEFYNSRTVPYGSLCSSVALTRKCSKGVFDGSDTYQYATCTVNGPSSCTLDNKSVAHGTSSTFYSSGSVAFGQVCSSIGASRTCTNGILSGSDTFNKSTCSVGAAQNCTLDGKTVAHGASDTFYLYSTAPFGSTCGAVSLSRACTNGVLSGGATYTKASCSGTATPSVSTNKTSYKQGEQISATFSGGTNSASDWVGIITAGQASYSPPKDFLYVGGSTTSSVAKIDGTLLFPSANSINASNLPIGNYEARFYNSANVLLASSNFSVTAGSECVLDGKTVAHGASDTFYSSQNASYAQGCAAISKVRACSNGVLSESSTYQFATCTVGTPSVTTNKTSYTAGETISVTFANGSNSAKDRIEIWKVGNTARSLWWYVDNTQAGLVAKESGVVSFASTLALVAGNYEVRFYKTVDSVDSLLATSSAFAITTSSALQNSLFNLASVLSALEKLLGQTPLR